LQTIAILLFTIPFTLFFFEFTLFEIQIFIGDFDKPLAFLLFDVGEVCSQPIDILNAKSRFQGGF
jgi:hypothetical protein